VAGGYQAQLEAAGRALRNGEIDRAQQLFQAVLAKEPGNTEAMAGIAEVARLRNDSATAQKMYDQVLAKNPSYLPALVARADQRWDSGDRQGAVVLYRRILEQAGADNPYGQRAASRLAEAARGGTPVPTAQPIAPAPKPSTPAPAPQPGGDQPVIDTTDLPEFNE
jgi:predicted Zn-dependent protease